jgi:chromatin modification-related protein EAF6
MQRKEQVDNTLANLEVQIFHFEGSYLEDTQANGNILKGFDGYLVNRSMERKRQIKETDRIFSNSSLTYPKVVNGYSNNIGACYTL